MKILALSVRNFAGIDEAEIRPGKLTVFAGKNAAGKSTLLKSIRAALEGADPVTIRQGTDRAEILVDLEEIRVRRVIRPSGSVVEVSDPKGFRRPSPQAYLNSLLGTVQFNPMEFLRAKPVARRQMLLEAVSKKVTFDEITEVCGEIVPGLPKEGPALDMYALAAKHFYDARTGVNKEAARLKTLHFEEMKRLPGDFVPDPEIDGKVDKVRDDIQRQSNLIAGLAAEKKVAEKAKETRRKLSETIARDEETLGEFRKFLEVHATPPDIERAQAKVDKLRTLLKDAEAELEAAQQQARAISECRVHVADLTSKIATDKETLSGLPGEFDVTRIEAAEKELATFFDEQTILLAMQRLMKVHASIVSLEADRKETDARAEALSRLVATFREELPEKVLAEANLPIEGLRIEGDAITVRGLPLDSLSGAERMEFVISIVRALAANNPLKLICVDGVEQLDDEAFAAFKERSQKDEFQYWVTRVGSPREGEVEIAAGKVVA